MSELEEDLKEAMEEVADNLSYTFNRFAVTSKQFAEAINNALVTILYEDEEWLVEYGALIDDQNNIAVYKKLDDGENIKKEISDLPKGVQNEVLKEII